MILMYLLAKNNTKEILLANLHQEVIYTFIKNKELKTS